MTPTEYYSTLIIAAVLAIGSILFALGASQEIKAKARSPKQLRRRSTMVLSLMTASAGLVVWSGETAVPAMKEIESNLLLACILLVYLVALALVSTKLFKLLRKLQFSNALNPKAPDWKTLKATQNGKDAILLLIIIVYAAYVAHRVINPNVPATQYVLASVVMLILLVLLTGVSATVEMRSQKTP